MGRCATRPLLPEVQNAILLAPRLLDLRTEAIEAAPVAFTIFVALPLLQLTDAEFELVVAGLLVRRQSPIAIAEIVVNGCMLSFPSKVHARRSDARSARLPRPSPGLPGAFCRPYPAGP